MKAMVQGMTRPGEAQDGSEHEKRQAAPYRAAVDFFRLGSGGEQRAVKPKSAGKNEPYRAAIDFFKLGEK